MEFGINLSKFKHHRITTKKGTKCIVLLIDENNFIEDKNSDIHSYFQSWDLKKVETNEHGFKKTHLIKQKLTKEEYNALTEEQKKAMPIFGNVTEYVGKGSEENIYPVIVQEIETEFQQTDDLPF